MNAGLKRIEATLHDLGNRGTASAAETVDSTTKRPFSFRISVGANEPTETTQTPSSRDGTNLQKLHKLHPLGMGNSIHKDKQLTSV